MAARKASKPQQFKYRCALENWATNLANRVEGKAKPLPRPKALANDDLLAVYPIGDPHFGLYSWGAESGEDFDLKIAERVTYAAIDALVASAPPAKRAVILELGDFFHADDDDARTQSGHALDTDTRHARVTEIGLDAMIYVTKAALRKHQFVTVRIVSGNHDRRSSVALRNAVWAYFHNEPRVTVDRSPADRWYYRHGKVLICSAHGDKCKPKNMPPVMAAERPKDWGASEFRYVYVGHVHHKSVTEVPGCVVESFRTLAPRDAWHAGQGYHSGRDMQAIILHKTYGERERYTWPIQKLNSGQSPTSNSRKARPATKRGARLH